MTGLFGGSAPKPPPIQPPAVMPTPDDAAIKAAKQRQLASIMARSGRQSTVLTDNSGQNDKLGA